MPQTAKVSYFGDSSKNVQYYHVLKTAMKERGNPMELVFADYNATIFAMSKITVYEENRSQKSEGLHNLALIERKAFLLKWHADIKGLLQVQIFSVRRG